MNTTPATMTKRPADERGHADHGWLQARFSFSFAEYSDPDHMGFRSLRVMNNDTIQPGGGFPMHPHDNMEIFTYVVEGKLAHKDSMGNVAVIEAGNLQYMSAGSGVRHSEFNPSRVDPALLYQIWMQPAEHGGAPRYAEKPLGDRAEKNVLTLLFSGDGHDGSTRIRQQAEISFARVDPDHRLAVPGSEEMPHLWIQVIKGTLDVHGVGLATGDGLALKQHPEALDVHALEHSEFLLFRLS